MAKVSRRFLLLTLCLLLATGCGQVNEPPAAEYEVDTASATQEHAHQENSAEANPTQADPPTTDSADQPESSAETPPPADRAAEADEAPAEAQQPEAEPIVEQPEDNHPFARRIEMPPLPEGMTWLNTSGPLRLKDLRGKYVILDFWTYCCINCMHVLPELKKLEEKYPNEVVVIGVHSAKFETEQESENIRDAILRHNIAHPVVNDANHKIWNSYGVSSWPTLIMVDPAGDAVMMKSGETKFELLDQLISESLPYYREEQLLDDSPVHFDLLARKAEATPLRYPGKVLADPAGKRLFISDSNHNRIVITDLAGKLLEIIGSGAEGHNDGNYQQATFKQPQGLFLQGTTLYVSDTENHLLREVDLEAHNVTTIAGTGEQGAGWPGMESLSATAGPPDRWVGKPLKTALNSPWAVWIHDQQLYIAMAGPHQIWKMPLDRSEIGPYAGNGREDIVDGPLLPDFPYDQGYCSFAQPSGLASDGNWLYVADSEGSSIRAVPFDPEKEVRTVVGTADLAGGRLFTFGDVDGPKEEVLLQHALGITHHEGSLYIADTYNNKIKVIDAKSGTTKTLTGQKEPGLTDGAAEKAQFDEPAGLAYADGKLFVADTNNHAIRVVDVSTGEVTSLEIADLSPPPQPKAPAKPSFAGAPVVQLDPVSVKPVEGQVTLQWKLSLPQGWKLNPLAPMGYLVEADGEEGALERKALGEFKKLKEPSADLPITLPVSGEGEESVEVSLIYYYCQQGGEGICKVDSVVWKVPLTIAADAKSPTVTLPLAIEP